MDNTVPQQYDLLALVWVKLTTRGEEHLLATLKKTEGLLGYDKLVECFNDHHLNKGWYEFSLGDLMRTFGGLCHDGYATPFVENKVYFQKPR